METSILGMMELAAHEGIVQMPYRDSVGVWTWSIGLTAAAGQGDPAKMPKGVPIPLDKCLKAFRAALTKYEAGVNRAVKVPLKQHEFDALVSFHYNTGAIGKASFVKRLNAGDRTGAAAGMMAWNKPPEIIGRRQKEQALFRDGKYTSGGFANVYPASASGKVLWGAGKRMDLRGVFAEPSASVLKRQPDEEPATPEPIPKASQRVPDAVLDDLGETDPIHMPKEPEMAQKTGTGSIIGLIVIVGLVGLFVYAKFFGGWI